MRSPHGSLKEASEKFGSVVALRGQSGHDFHTQHPSARAGPVVNFAWNRLRSSGFGVNRTSTRHGNVARRIPSAFAAASRVRAIVPVNSPAAVPSTCNPARLGIRESVSLQRFWVGGRCQPRSVLRRFAIRLRPAGSEGSARSAVQWPNATIVSLLRREIGAREPRHRGTQLRDSSGIAGYGEGRARAWRQKALR